MGGGTDLSEGPHVAGHLHGQHVQHGSQQERKLISNLDDVLFVPGGQQSVLEGSSRRSEDSPGLGGRQQMFAEWPSLQADPVSEEVVNLVALERDQQLTASALVGKTFLQGGRALVSEDAPVTLPDQMLTSAAGTLKLASPESSSVTEYPLSDAVAYMRIPDSDPFMSEDHAISSKHAQGPPASELLVGEDAGPLDAGHASLDASAAPQSVTSTGPGEPTHSQANSTDETRAVGSEPVLPEQAMGEAGLGPERLTAPRRLKQAVQQMIVQAKIVHSGDERPAAWALLRQIECLSGGPFGGARVDALWKSLVEGQAEGEGLPGNSGCPAGAEVARTPAERLVADISKRLECRLKLKMKWDNVQKFVVTAGLCGAVATGGAVVLLASASATVASFGFWGSLMYPAAAQAAVAAEAAAATAVGLSGGVTYASALGGALRHLITLSPSLREYMKILQAMLEILPAMNQAEEGIQKVKEEPSPRDLEDAIVERWTSLGYGLEGDVDLKRLGEQVLTDESLNELVIRIRLLVAIRQLGETMSHTAFVAVVGPQNVGKSTLIKQAGSLLGLDLSVIVGPRKHTQHVRGYPLHPRLWLVDFPGLNDLMQDTAEMWQGFCEVPSLCVLLLPFKGGHPDADDVQLYRQVAGRLAGVELLVVVNKADHDLDEDETTAEELEECKAAYCSALGCNIDSLAFSSLEPKTFTSALGSLGVWDTRKVCCRVVERAAALIGGDEELKNVFSV